MFIRPLKKGGCPWIRLLHYQQRKAKGKQFEHQHQKDPAV